ncbi:hypothetical protein ACOTWN_11005, partial [Aliarcobacter butzleri]
KRIIYVKTPGSFMAIKIAYIFLKTVCLTKNKELNSVSVFEFNNNSPIKALVQKYFINETNNLKVDF